MYEFETGFRGRFVVTDSERDVPFLTGGQLRIEVAANGLARAPIAQVHVLDTLAQCAGGDPIPTHAFLYHHVPREPLVVWLFGMRQNAGEAWEAGGCVGSFAEAEKDYRDWIEPR